MLITKLMTVIAEMAITGVILENSGKIHGDSMTSRWTR